MTSRRDFLNIAGLAAAGALISSCREQPLEPLAARDDLLRSLVGGKRLRDVATARGVMFGMAASWNILTIPDVAARVGAEAGFLTAPSFYMRKIRPTQFGFDFTRAEYAVEFARRNNLQCRGHTLVWHYLLPGWLDQQPPRWDAAVFLANHIRRVVATFAGRCQQWDVINEPVSDPVPPTGSALRDTFWLRRIGPDYLDIALHAARGADPDALLGINEYGLEAGTLASARKREATLRLLADLKSRGAPVDYLGIQGHVRAFQRAPVADLVAFVGAVNAMDIRVFVTELDVSDENVVGSIRLRDKAVADTYRDFLDCLVGQCRVRSVVTWGFSDRHSWLRNRRRDGLPTRPLLFDDAYQPKAALSAVIASLESVAVGRT